MFNSYKYNFLQRIVLVSFSFIYLCSCNITKYVPEDEYLLRQSDIELSGSYPKNFFSIDEFNNLLTQKPNRNLFSNFKFYLMLYNLSDQQKIDEKIRQKQLKIDNKNKKINQKNQKLLELDSASKIKSLKERSLVLGERLQNRGEKPVIYNSLSAQQTKDQFSKYLFNKGYFKPFINDTVIKLENSNQINVIYSINVGSPTLINQVNYRCNDLEIAKYLDSIKSNSLLKCNEIFDTDNLIKERNRINRFLRDRGFYLFDKEFIYFELDSSKLSNKIDLTLGIQNYKISNAKGVDELSHQKYKIDKINVRILPYNFNSSYKVLDSLITPQLSIYNYQSVNFKDKVFYKSIPLKENTFYNSSLVEKTYRRLTSLGLFKYVNIGFDIKNNNLEGNIDLTPTKVQDLSISLDGTNNERLFGFQGSLEYAHKNLFHAGEKILLSLKSSFEIQLLLTDAEQSNVSNSLNTREIGPELHYFLPKYFLINKIGNLKKHVNPLTEFTAAFNVQDRPDYKRVNQELSFGWVFHENKNITWHINPMLLSIVDVSISKSFQDQIDQLNDIYISSSFQDHVVAGGVYSFEYNDQNLNLNTNSFYAKVTFETAGGALFRLHELIKKDKNPISNSYDFLGIRYAHFQKTTFDLRFYQPVANQSKMVFRFFSGIGQPRKNLIEALPFEKSFYVGGSNSLRAWRARSLGPGGFNDSLRRFDKIGDIKIESNLEYRFPISRWLEGAFFLDFGNIWLSSFDSLRPEGQFRWNQFINDVAIGGGFGARLNFEYFILRMDVAIPIKDPSLNSPWIFNYQNKWNTYFPVQLNLGIGYPF